MDRPDQRSDARERALYLLYEAHSKGIAPSTTLDLQVLEPDHLTKLLVNGVDDRLGEIDALIDEKSVGWTLSRMPIIDLTVMRLATFELIERVDIPVPVVLDEAVKLAKQFSTDDSGRFVNGVLAAIAKHVRPVAGDEQTGDEPTGDGQTGADAR